MRLIILLDRIFMYYCSIAKAKNIPKPGILDVRSPALQISGLVWAQFLMPSLPLLKMQFDVELPSANALRFLFNLKNLIESKIPS